MDDFRKADKQDGGHCGACRNRAYALAMEGGDYETAEKLIRNALPLAQTSAERATLHFKIGFALERQGISEKKDKYFSASCDEIKTALALDPGLVDAHYVYGISLAYLHQDEAAVAQFRAFAKQDAKDPGLRIRAQRFIEHPELARARMAPAFTVTTLDGQTLSMDSLQGKVVLIDFWATWCEPCREALPHMQEIVKKFHGQPFVALSVSLDNNEARWKDFVRKNGMTWPQYRDGGFNGPMATMFGVRAIPSTFSIDADGVLEDQHVGDANIESKLKKLIAEAVVRDKQPQSAKPDGLAQASGR